MNGTEPQPDEMTASSNPSIGSGSKSIQEPNVDFELDIKVFIDSGKCVLHPKDSKDDEQRKLVLTYYCPEKHKK